MKEADPGEREGGERGEGFRVCNQRHTSFERFRRLQVHVYSRIL